MQLSLNVLTPLSALSSLKLFFLEKEELLIRVAHSSADKNEKLQASHSQASLCAWRLTHLAVLLCIIPQIGHGKASQSASKDFERLQCNAPNTWHCAKYATYANIIQYHMRYNLDTLSYCLLSTYYTPKKKKLLINRPPPFFNIILQDVNGMLEYIAIIVWYWNVHLKHTFDPPNFTMIFWGCFALAPVDKGHVIFLK